MDAQRKLTRRSFLGLSGALLIGVAGGGVVRAVQQGVFTVGQGAAYEPWTTWREDMGEGPLSLVRAAILASSPHNSQPWLFRVTDSRIDLFADTTRQIGTIDPFLREMYLGLGCALENMLLAAQAEGYTVQLTYLPTAAEPTHAARLDLRAGTRHISPLYEMIPTRRTNRLAYDVTRPVEPAQLERLAALNNDPAVRLLWITDPTARAAFGAAIVAATAALIADDQQSIDGHLWWRGSWQELQTKRDGVTPDAGQEPLFAAFIKMLPETDRATADAAFLDQTRNRHTATAMGYGIIAIAERMNNEHRLRAGELWQRIHLQATQDGLAVQPLNQLPERADREIQLGLEPQFTTLLAEFVGDAAFTGVMPFRFGYPAALPAAPAPRRAVESVLI